MSGDKHPTKTLARSIVAIPHVSPNVLDTIGVKDMTSKTQRMTVNDLYSYVEATKKAKFLLRDIEGDTWRNYAQLWAEGVLLHKTQDKIAVGTAPNPDTGVREKISGDGA